MKSWTAQTPNLGLQSRPAFEFRLKSAFVFSLDAHVSSTIFELMKRIPQFKIAGALHSTNTVS
jgi:hypothetical protein